MASIAEEAFSNIRCVKSFAMEETESRLHLRESEKLKDKSIWLAGGIGIFQAGSNLFLNGIVLSILYFGGKQISTNEITPGDLMAFMVASQTVQVTCLDYKNLSSHKIFRFICTEKFEQFESSLWSFY